jgi:hypothetical protein
MVVNITPYFEFHVNSAGLCYALVGRPLIAAGTTIVVDGKA